MARRIRECEQLRELRFDRKDLRQTTLPRLFLKTKFLIFSDALRHILDR